MGTEKGGNRLKTNYLLIDYENIHPKNLSLLSGHPFKVLVFAGANQTKVPLELAAALQPLGKDVRYITISGSGRNALDFHIAFSIGELSKEDPEACFYIISKDTGFDPLISHLKTRKLRALRVTTVGDIPLLKTGNAKSTPDRIAMIVDDLRKRGAAKPRTLTTLTSTIGALFLKQLSSDEIGSLLNALKGLGYVSVSGTKVTYNLPT